MKIPTREEVVAARAIRDNDTSTSLNEYQTMLDIAGETSPHPASYAAGILLSYAAGILLGLQIAENRLRALPCTRCKNPLSRHWHQSHVYVNDELEQLAEEPKP